MRLRTGMAPPVRLKGVGGESLAAASARVERTRDARAPHRLCERLAMVGPSGEHAHEGVSSTRGIDGLERERW